MADADDTAARWADQMGAPPCDCLPHVGPYHRATCPRGKWWNNEGLLLGCGLPASQSDAAREYNAEIGHSHG